MVKLFALLIFFLCAPSALADVVSCPKKLDDVRQNAKSTMPNGWQADLVEFKRHTLYRAEISTKDETGGSLRWLAEMPANQDDINSNDKINPIWDVEGTDRYWLRCFYEGTPIVLIKQIKGLNRCKFEYSYSLKQAQCS